MHEPTKQNLVPLIESAQLACQPQNAGRIIAGRKQTAALPRAFVLEHIRNVGAESLDLPDYWEYSRFLELLDRLETRDILIEMISEGQKCSDPDVRDMADLWGSNVSSP